MVENWYAGKKTCSNRRFQNRETFSSHIGRFNTELKGVGILAKQQIPQGAFILEYHGEIMTPEEYADKVKASITASASVLKW